MIRISFICLGNICRSPLAEGLARREVERRGLGIAVESAGTGGWHINAPPDRRMQAKAREYGLDISGLRGAQVTAADASRVDLFVAMDRSNQRNLEEILAGHSVRIVRLLEFHAGPENEVPDPYYGGDDGFEHAWQLVASGIRGLLDALEAGSDPRLPRLG